MYFVAVILIPESKPEQSELSIALIANYLKSRGQNALLFPEL